MMMGFGMFGIVELLLVVLLLGNPGLPLGVPPAEEDPLMFRLAPQECLYYATWAGIAAPDGASENSTEQMLAQEELQVVLRRVDAITTMLSQRMADEGDPVGKVLGELAPTLIRTMLTRATAFYVADVQLVPQGLAIEAALVVDAGEQQDALLQALNRLVNAELVEELEAQVETVQIQDLDFTKVRFQGNLPPIFWGVRGRYLVVAAGEGTVQNLFERVETDPPAWLVELRKELPVERTASVAYLNLAGIQKLTQPWANAEPELAGLLLKRLQLENALAYRCVTGLDESGYQVHSQLVTDGPVTLLELLADEPLTLEELGRIPSASPLVLATKFDISQAADLVLELAPMMFGMAAGPDAIKDDMSAGIEQMLGVDLERLLTRILDDTVYIYASPTDGGLVTGWTLVVRLKEPMQAQQCAQRFFGFMAAMFRNEEQVNLRTEDFDSYTLNIFEVEDDDLPVVPSWAVTEDELVISLFPQALKSHLARGLNHSSIEQLPEIAQRFEEGDPMKGEGPRVVIQLDHAELIRLVYPMIQVGAVFAIEELNEELDLDINVAELPSVAALTRHTKPMVATLNKDSQGYDWRVRQTIPTGDLVTSAPMIAALSLPAVTAARLGARRTQSSNNLKQLALSLHNFHDTYNSFPAAYNADKQGKPLLSWRVQILPYLEQNALYEQFRLDEPWDSEHNKKLISKMPPLFAVPGNDPSEGLTNYLGVAGSDKMFPPPQREDYGKPFAAGRKFQDVFDGTSNTAMIVEVNNENRVIWTKPDDFSAPGMQPLERIMGLWKRGFQVGVADGSVRMISEDVDPDELQNLFKINDGNVIEIPFLR